jgi:PIN domain nuclease of toxin-antitoxin system
VRLLLDTQIFIWLENATERIRPDAYAMLRDQSNDIWVSAASIWEIAIKQASNKIDFKGSPLAVARRREYRLLDIRPEHAEEAAALPMHHRDPFDRILVAQGRLENLTLVTNDPAIRRYSVTVL